MRVRWKIFLFLFGFGFIAYVQARSLSVASYRMMPDLDLSQIQIGWLEEAFLVSYSAMQFPGGLIGQRLGARLMFVVIGLIAFASCMAATTALTQLLLVQGDHAVCSDNVYGGTFRLFDKIVRHYGIDFSYVNTSDLEGVERAMRPNTRMVFVETPTNPLMAITDIQAVCRIAHQKDARVIVDNTFMSPFFQRPLVLEPVVFVEVAPVAGGMAPDGGRDVLGVERRQRARRGDQPAERKQRHRRVVDGHRGLLSD